METEKGRDDMEYLGDKRQVDEVHGWQKVSELATCDAAYVYVYTTAYDEEHGVSSISESQWTSKMWKC